MELAEARGVDLVLRGRGRGRHPDHPRAARGARLGPHRRAARHHQRHRATTSCRRCSSRGSTSPPRCARRRTRGYAEADPTLDVGGGDAAHKLTILATLAFGIPLQFDRVYTEGITRITRADIDYAEQLGYRIKHLGIARNSGTTIELRVHPTLIPKRQLLASVMGVMNAVLIKGDADRPEPLLRRRCRRGAHGLGGGRGSRGRGQDADLGPGEPGPPSRLPTTRTIGPRRGPHGRRADRAIIYA